MRYSKAVSAAGGLRAPTPIRSRRHNRLVVGLTLQAVAGLGGLSALIVGSLALGLWCAFSGQTGLFPLNVVLALMIVGVAAYLLTWLWQPPSDVSGVPVVREDSPELFKVLDRLCTAYDVPAIDRVMIGADMNAAVVQLPELGLWGRLRTTLLVGLPTLHSLNPQQFRAILAHELSHLAFQRRPLAAWAAQLRAWWHRVLAAIDDDPTPVGRLAAMLLAAHAETNLYRSVELSHLEEFEADAGAAGHVGADTLAAALLELAMKERYLREEYWDAVMSQFEFPDAGDGILPFGTMGIGVSLGFQRSEQCGRMGELLELPPGLDLHPSLPERLEALSVGAHSPIRQGPSAAQLYLGGAADGLACRLDRAWCMAIAPCCGK
ncbi:MAG: M48 family metalloprotease [Rhodocyclaceae bacterium]|nr:M48 family metalloprotease [Rhodocyclaceae bacterium]